MSRRFDSCSLWIVDHRWLTVAFMLLITALASVGYVQPTLFRDWIKQVRANLTGEAAEELSDSEEGFYNVQSEPSPDVQSIDLAGSDAILIVESDSMFTPQGAEAVRSIVAALEKLDYVDQVTWMDELPGLNIFGLPEPVLPNSKATQTRFEVAKQKAIDNPFVGGQLMSKDARTMLLLVNFNYFYIQKDEDCIGGLSSVAADAAKSFADFDAEFTVTGRMPIYLTAGNTRDANRLKYQIIAYSLIGLLSIILFRGITAIAIVGFAPALGVFWSLGILRLFDFQDNPFNDVILPVMISLVGFTDGVHLMVQIRKLRADGLSPRSAAREGIQLVGLACALTSLTTAIGFASLTLAHHEIVQEFGWSCVIGVTLSFIAVITSVPLLSSTWLGRRVQIGHSRGLIDRNLNRISFVVDFVLKHKNKFAFGGIGLTLLLCGITATLRPDERLEDSLPATSEASIGMRKLDKAMGGLEHGQINVQWNRNVESDSPQVLEVIRKFDDILRGEKLIGNPISIRSLLDALPGDGDEVDRMSMLELLPPPVKRAYYQPEIHYATISFRVQDLGIATYNPVFRRLQNEIEKVKAEYPDFQITLDGRPVWRWENLYQIVIDLVISLGTASVVIFLVLSVVYRSLRIGFISVIPNVFPLAVAGTYLVLSGNSLELISVCAFTVCLGIAVDDTIHFLTRYREELEMVDEKELAIRRAFTAVGTALIMTTLVLIGGLLSVLFSDNRDHQIFARMGALTIGSALLGDIIFLPAILARFDKVKRDSKSPWVGQ